MEEKGIPSALMSLKTITAICGGGGNIIHSIINMFSGNISVYLPSLFLHLSAFNFLNQNGRYTGGCVKVHISYSSGAW